jgi:protein SCO1/2
MVGDVANGMWMRNSATDNPLFLATTIGNFLGWKSSRQDVSYAEARPLNIGKGEFLFQSRCSACHTIGGGDRVGPDLLGVTDRRDHAWLARFVLEPEKVLAEGDPIATDLFRKYKQVRMPNVELGSDDVVAVLAYIQARSRPPAAPTGKDAVAGNAAAPGR